MHHGMLFGVQVSVAKDTDVQHELLPAVRQLSSQVRAGGVRLRDKPSRQATNVFFAV